MRARMYVVQGREALPGVASSLSTPGAVLSTLGSLNGGSRLYIVTRVRVRVPSCGQPWALTDPGQRHAFSFLQCTAHRHSARCYLSSLVSTMQGIQVGCRESLLIALLVYSPGACMLRASRSVYGAVDDAMMAFRQCYEYMGYILYEYLVRRTMVCRQVN